MGIHVIRLFMSLFSDNVTTSCIRSGWAG